MLSKLMIEVSKTSEIKKDSDQPLGYYISKPLLRKEDSLRESRLQDGQDGQGAPMSQVLQVIILAYVRFYMMQSPLSY